MKSKTIVATLTAAGILAGFVAPVMAAPKTPAVSTQNGISTSTAAASDAFPGLKGFLNLPAKDRSQVNIYYVAKIKHADKAQVKITLLDGARAIPLTIQADGRITPLPTREQLNSGAKITISGPATGSYAMRIKVTPTQPLGVSYDAAGLALGVKQGNAAMSKVAGAASFLLKKLDRVYFVGGGNATVEIGGQKKALPRTTVAGEYPAGTPYYRPADLAGATRIVLSTTPSAVLFDTPAK